MAITMLLMLTRGVALVRELLRLWMSDVFQLLGTLRNKLRCTLRHLRQQLRHSLRASEIRLRRTVRTDFLLRVPPRWSWSFAPHPACDADHGLYPWRRVEVRALDHAAKLIKRHVAKLLAPSAAIALTSR
jgi:hypothetical protein